MIQRRPYRLETHDGWLYYYLGSLWAAAAASVYIYSDTQSFVLILFHASSALHKKTWRAAALWAGNSGAIFHVTECIEPLGRYSIETWMYRSKAKMEDQLNRRNEHRFLIFFFSPFIRPAALYVRRFSSLRCAIPFSAQTFDLFFDIDDDNQFSNTVSGFFATVYIIPSRKWRHFVGAVGHFFFDRGRDSYKTIPKKSLF